MKVLIISFASFFFGGALGFASRIFPPNLQQLEDAAMLCFISALIFALPIAIIFELTFKFLKPDKAAVHKFIKGGAVIFYISSFMFSFWLLRQFASI